MCSHHLLLATAFFAAITAGITYAWFYTLNSTTREFSNAQFVSVMKSITQSLHSIGFFLLIVAASILLPATTIAYYCEGVTLEFLLLLIGSIVYLAGVLCVTFYFTVPLLKTVELLSIEGSQGRDFSFKRSKFEHDLTKLNVVRAICSSITVVIVVIVCCKQNMLTI